MTVYHKFKDKDGNLIVLPGHLTIKDLLMMGFSGPTIKPKGSPLSPGEYRECGTANKITPAHVPFVKKAKRKK